MRLEIQKGWQYGNLPAPGSLCLLTKLTVGWIQQWSKGYWELPEYTILMLCVHRHWLYDTFFLTPESPCIKILPMKPKWLMNAPIIFIATCRKIHPRVPEEQNHAVNSVQSLSRVWLFATSWTTACQAQTQVHRVSDAIQPSHPLSSLSPPAFNLSQHQGLFQGVSFSHRVAKVLEFQLQHQSF